MGKELEWKTEFIDNLEFGCMMNGEGQVSWNDDPELEGDGFGAFFIGIGVLLIFTVMAWYTNLWKRMKSW